MSVHADKWFKYSLTQDMNILHLWKFDLSCLDKCIAQEIATMTIINVKVVQEPNFPNSPNNKLESEKETKTWLAIQFVLILKRKKYNLRNSTLQGFGVSSLNNSET